MSKYFNPILAKGKSQEKTATASVGASVSTVSIDNSGGEYEVGDFVFVSQSDYSTPHYCGTVTAASAASIAFEIATTQSLGASAKVWQPTSYFRATYGPGFAESRARIQGPQIVSDRSGSVHITQTSDSLYAVTLSWPNTIPTDWDQLQTFVETNLSGGIDSFTLAWFDHFAGSQKVYAVKMDPGNMSVSMINKFVCQFSQQFFLITADTFL